METIRVRLVTKNKDVVDSLVNFDSNTELIGKYHVKPETIYIKKEDSPFCEDETRTFFHIDAVFTPEGLIKYGKMCERYKTKC